MKVITSRDNATYKSAQKLLRKKSRDRAGQFLLEGTKPLRDALEMGLMVEKIFACSEEVLRDWMPHQRCILLDRTLFAEISDTVHSQGIIAVVERPVTDLQALQTADGPLVVLDRLQDPGNAGTIIRTAEAAGFAGILAMTGTTDLYGPKVVRAAAGSLLRMPVVTDLGTDQLLELVAGSGRSLVVTALEGARDCFAEALPENAALVIGSEGSGVSDALLAAADLRVKIPMQGEIESLNAAVAAGILMYQCRRR